MNKEILQSRIEELTKSYSIYELAVMVAELESEKQFLLSHLVSAGITFVIEPLLERDYHESTESIEILGLSVRTRNQLRRNGISTIGQLAVCNKEQLLAWRETGAITVQEIINSLQVYRQKHQVNNE